MVTIDYGRCGRSNIDLTPLSAWNIDPVTKALLEPEGERGRQAPRTVTFTHDPLFRVRGGGLT